MDMEQPCFMGWHRKWALGLGVPTVFTFALLIPVGMFWLLKANAGRATELRFREHFGFLYRWVGVKSSVCSACVLVAIDLHCTDALCGTATFTHLTPLYNH